MATIKQTMSTEIQRDPNNRPSVVDEAHNGLKAVPVELVVKADDDSTFSQINGGNGLPVQFTSSAENPIHTVTELKGSYVRQSTAPRPSGKEGDRLFLWDTREVFLHDGTEWRDV